MMVGRRRARRRGGGKEDAGEKMGRGQEVGYDAVRLAWNLDWATYYSRDLIER